MSKLIESFTIIASIATAISAFVAARTLFSIRKQRETTYKPELIIEENEFYIYSSISRKRQTEYSYDVKQFDYKSSMEFPGRFSAKLFNIGLGAAKNISVEIDFNTFEVISQINKKKSLSDNFSALIVQNRLQISYDNTLQSSLPINSGNLDRINYVLPSSISREPTLIHIPTYILELYSIVVYNYWKHSKINNPNNFPFIKVKIEYSDIGGKRISKLYHLTFDFQGGSADTSWNILKVIEVNP